MTPADPMLRLLARLGEEGVEYVLVGGQAVRLNGFLRATEDVDLLVRASRLRAALQHLLSDARLVEATAPRS